MDTSTRVLVVDDEPEIVDVMRDFLEAEGFGVEIARNGREALAALARAPVDCLLLDVMMPGLSGFDLARRIRETSDVPIRFLSARDTPTDKIRGLIGGGDDYIVKSATAAEVVARAKAVLRRTRRGTPPVDAGVLHFGRLVVDTRRHEVRVEGRPVLFAVREFEILRLLAIARRILQAHGGDLTAAIRSGGGAMFTGTLPLQHPAPPPVDPVKESLAHTP